MSAMFADIVAARQCLVYVWVDDIPAHRSIAVYGGFYPKRGTSRWRKHGLADDGGV